MDHHYPQPLTGTGGYMKTLLQFARLAMTVGCIGLAAAQDAQPLKPSFSLALSAPESTVHVGSAIKLSIKMTNISDHDIYHVAALIGGEMKLRSNLVLNVSNSEGNPATETALGKEVHDTEVNRPPRSGSIFNSRVVVKPGKTTTETRVLNEEFDLNNPGTYTVKAQRRDPESNLLVESNALKITVIP